MRIALCKEHARRFETCYEITPLGKQGMCRLCFCARAGTVYEAVPKDARVKKRKPPYIQNKEKQMKRRRWA